MSPKRPRRRPKPAPKNRGGRPCELTPDVLDICVRARRAGLSWEDCAALAGVTDRTLKAWRDRGLADEKAGIESRFLRFLRESSRARAQRRLEALERIEKHGKGKRKDSWKAEAWFAAVSDPETFGRRRVDVAGVKDAAPVLMQVITGIAKSPEDDRQPTREALGRSGQLDEEDATA